MSLEYLFTGYVDCGADGLLPVEIIKQDDGHISAWVGGDLADDADGVEDFAAAYGESLYLSTQGYRDGNSESVFDIWKE